MRKSLAILLSMLMLIAAAGCGEKSGDSSDRKDQQTNAVSSTGLVGSTTSTSKSVGTTTTTQPADEPAEKPYMDEMKARYNADEKNGYSLWGFSDEEKYCVDAKGYLVFTLDAKEKVKTSVYQNAFVTNSEVVENENKYVVSKLWQASTGEVLYTADAREGNYIVKYSEDIHQDGYFIAVHIDESYNGVTYQMGILKSDGQWAVPMSEDNPVLTTMGDNVSLDIFKNMDYYGEGFLYFAVDRNHYFYNIVQNEVVTIQSELMTNWYTESTLESGGPFVNGMCFEGTLQGEYCKITSDGKITIYPINYHDDVNTASGSFYYDAANDKMIKVGYNRDGDGISVCDSKGNIIKSIPDVTLADVNGFTADGVAQIVLKNKEGTYYYTMIDINGEFLFEPIKMERTYVMDVNGKIVGSSNDSYKGYNCTIVDREGNVLYETEDGEKIYYQNGIVHSDKLQGPDTYVLIAE